jgi:hypothetical protein
MFYALDLGMPVARGQTTSWVRRGNPVKDRVRMNALNKPTHPTAHLSLAVLIEV